MTTENALIKRQKIIFFFLYFFSFIFLILNFNGIYWDDWVLFNQKDDFVINLFSSTGNKFVGYYNIFLLNHFGVWFYRFLTFIFYAISSLFLWKTLDQIDLYNKKLIFPTILVFTLVSFNDARIAIINFGYALCYLSYFIGLYYLFKYSKNQKVSYRVISLLTFFYSFYTNSFLLLYVCPVIFLLITKLDKNNLKGSFILFHKRYWQFLILPFIFFIIKKTIHIPSGNYSGYNKIVFNRFTKAIWLTPKVILDNIESLFQISEKNHLIYTCLLIPIIFLLLKLTIKEVGDQISFKKLGFLALIGFFLLYFGVYPYVAVAKPPRFYEFESRNQLLMPLGFSFLLNAVILTISRLLKFKWAYTILLSICICLFIVKNNVAYLSYLREWNKVTSILDLFSTSKVIRGNHTFLINDVSRNENANYRFLRFYEWSGYSKLVFKDENRFFWYLSSYPDLKSRNYKSMDDLKKKVSKTLHNSHQYQWEDKPSHLITISTRLSPTNFEIIKRTLGIKKATHRDQEFGLKLTEL